MTGRRLSIRDTSLYVEVLGHGYPLVLMHGGPARTTGPCRRSGASRTSSRWSSTTTDVAHAMLRGEWRAKIRPEALIYAGRELLDGWTVMDRLGEITVPTLVMAGRDDFLNPPKHQAALAAGLADGRLHIVDHAGHNPHEERTAEVMDAVRAFVGSAG